MELFVVSLVIYLNLPAKKPPKKDPWEEMGKALGAALKTLHAPADGAKDGGGGGGDKTGRFPWFIPLALGAGLLVYWLRDKKPLALVLGPQTGGSPF